MHPQAPPAGDACGMATDEDGCGGGGGDPAAPDGGDLYGVLGLSKECSDADLKVAYRKLAMTRSGISGRRTWRYARCGCLRGRARRPWRSLHMSWRGWTRSSS